MNKIKFDDVKDYKDIYVNLANDAYNSLINILSTTGRIEFNADIQPIRHLDGDILTIKAISYDADMESFLLELDNDRYLYDDFDTDYYDLFYLHEDVRCYLIHDNTLERSPII